MNAFSSFGDKLGRVALIAVCTAGAALAASCDEPATTSGESGGGPQGGAGPGPGSGAGGQGGEGAFNFGGAGNVPLFETDIVPILKNSCGSGDNACHSRVAYAAIVADGCRGWLALEDEALGSVYYDGPDIGQPTNCPDMPLYDRLLQLTAWQECDGVGKVYIVPCDVGASYVFDKIDDGPYCGETPGEPSEQMPPDMDLPAIEKATIKAWIEAGAPRVDGAGVDCNPGGGGSGGGPGNASPVPVITHPGDMETRPASVAVPFIGSASDVEDGALLGAALVWTSDVDGDLGTGTDFSLALSAGTHVVTLTATDSDGNNGATSVTLFMTP